MSIVVLGTGSFININVPRGNRRTKQNSIFFYQLGKFEKDGCLTAQFNIRYYLLTLELKVSHAEETGESMNNTFLFSSIVI